MLTTPPLPGAGSLGWRVLELERDLEEVVVEDVAEEVGDLAEPPPLIVLRKLLSDFTYESE